MNIFYRIKKWYYRPKSRTADFIQTLIVIAPIAFVIRTYFYGLYRVPTGSMERTMLVGEGFFADKFTVFFKDPNYGDIIAFNDPEYPYSSHRMQRLFQRYVWGPISWTKRVIGLPGDHMVGRVEDGKPVVYRNGVKLHESYINPYPLIGLFTQAKDSHIDFRTYDPNVSFEDQPFYRVDQLQVDRAARLLRSYPNKVLLLPDTPTTDARGRVVDEFDVILKKDECWVMGDNRKYSYDSRMWGPLPMELIHAKIVWRIYSLDTQESWLIWDILKNPFGFWKKIRWSRCFQSVT